MRRVSLALLVLGLSACGSTQTNGGATGEAGDGGGVLVGEGGSLLGDGGGGGGPPNVSGCSEAAKLIYVVSNDEMALYSFYPPTLTFTKIGQLVCGAQSVPFSMSVARDGTAWILYQDGHLYQASTKDASCKPTSFAPGQSGFQTFGMGFSADSPGSTKETLYACWTQGLAKIDTDTLALTPIGAVPGVSLMSGCDLTGTGDGTLYSFIPQQTEWLIATLDKSTSALTSKKSLTPPIPAGGSWGTSYWGGSLYLYTQTPTAPGSTVWKYDPVAGTTVKLKENIGFSIVGAGESTCAPTTPVK
jgi:hypothetical protein